MRQTNQGLLLLIALPAVLLTGCAEGPLWRLGYLNPWVVSKWEEEEKLLVEFSEKRSRIEQIRANASKMTQNQADGAVEELSHIADNEPILMIRVEATKTLGIVPSPNAVAELRRLSKDQDVNVRIAACQAIGKRPNVEAIPLLTQIIEDDSDIDVRLCATRQLAGYKNDQAAIDGLAIALNDPEPALRYRAMESLSVVTDRNLGSDARKWQAYLRGEPVPEDSRLNFVGGLPDIF